MAVERTVVRAIPARVYETGAMVTVLPGQSIRVSDPRFEGGIRVRHFYTADEGKYIARSLAVLSAVR